ncbi:MAG: hypothetical protein QM740_20065 [Acidovorax sp.]
MPNITDTLCAIERRAERALVQELRLMTQEILAMRTQLSLAHRAQADGLLLKLDHLQRCQQIDAAAAAAHTPGTASATQACAVAAQNSPTPSRPSHYLVHFYSHDVGEIERVVLTETLPAAAQLVRQHLSEQPRPVWLVTQDSPDGELRFLSGDDMVLAGILPCTPSAPEVHALVEEACAALAAGNLSVLRRLFVSGREGRPARLVA